VCVWNLAQPNSGPAKALYCSGKITSLGLSPTRAHVVFAGLSSGSLVLWDLREKPFLHKTTGAVGKGETEGKGGRGIVLRHPSYSTDHLLKQNHSLPVTRCLALPKAIQRDSKSSIRKTGRGGGDGGFQIVSMDSAGGTSVWTVVQLSSGDVAGSESDLGLNVGATVKLIKSADVVAPDDGLLGMSQLLANAREAGSTPETSPKIRNFRWFGGQVGGKVSGGFGQESLDLTLAAWDPSEFFIATGAGHVARRRRFGDSLHDSSNR
jgi:hypothetical protein